MATRVLYSDVNPDINSGSSYELVTNEDAINASILTILGTRKYSRVFNREFGSYLLQILFDPMDDRTAFRIKEEVISAIENWEPRVTLRETKVIPDYEKQQYYVELDYVIPSLNNKSSTFTFNLNRQL